MFFSRLTRKKTRPAVGFRTAQEEREPDARKSRLYILVLVGAFITLVLALLPRMTPITASFDEHIDYSALAPDDIQVEFDYNSEDLEATRKARDEAEAKVPDIHRVNRERVQERLAAFDALVGGIRKAREGMIDELRAALSASTSSQETAAVVWQVAMKRAEALTKGKPPLWGGDPAAVAVFLVPDSNSIPQREFEKSKDPDADLKVVALKEPEMVPLSFTTARKVLEATRNGLQYVLTYGIVDPATLSPKEGALLPPSIEIVRDPPVEGQQLSEVFAMADAPQPDSVVPLLRARIITALQEKLEVSEKVPAERAAIHSAALEISRVFVAPTLDFDDVTTAKEKAEARSAVEPKIKHIRYNDVIQHRGEEWTEQSRLDLEYYLETQRGQHPYSRFAIQLVARIILVGLALLCLARSYDVLRSRNKSPHDRINVAMLIMCSVLVAGRIVSYSEPSGFVVPVAAGAILLAILVNAQVAALTSLLMAMLLSIQYNYSWSLLVVQFAMSLAAILSIFVVRRRSDMTTAAMKATGVGVVAMVAVLLATDALFTEGALRQLSLIGLNGTICVFLVPGLLPPLERIFRITTDIQLLEYSDLNNAVLSRMGIEVPATYAHSLRLGQLAEAASDAIGANGLLAQVASYYHDIGKLRRPEYFSENQTGVNIHDELSPRLSARAIASHVIEGAEMAREFHLPKPIVDGILEHHGTQLISFFYQEALSQQKHGDVREEDFRYPGPKPQSRETAILMICDAAESSVRSIKNPNEERVREMVDKIVATRAADGQFDECDITLRELDTVKEVVTKLLLSTLHRRIAYPKQPFERKAVNVIRMPGGGES